MVAKISSGKSIFGVLQYNKIKLDDNTAKVLFRHKMFDSIDGKFSMQDCMDSFYPYLAANKKTENVVFHTSINPDPKDKLSDEQLFNLCQDYINSMGYGNQPYIIFKHQDIDRTHAHIVSLRIDETGKKISDKFENRRSMAICHELELKHKLHIPTKNDQRTDVLPLKKIDYRAGDIKHQVGNVAKSVMNNYHFQSLGEYRTLLEMFNVTVEEVKGKYKGTPYQGLIYSVINDKGERLSKPFKASLFGKQVGYDALQKHFLKSKDYIDKSEIKKYLTPIILQSMKQAHSIDDFRKSLLQSGIGCVFRQNEERRIYGVTFIDYQNQTILNGSRLGKEFSANIFNGLFNDSPARNIERAAEEGIPINNQPNNLSVRQDIGSDGLSLFDFEQHGTDYESEDFIRKKEREDKQRRKKRGRM